MPGGASGARQSHCQTLVFNQKVQCCWRLGEGTPRSGVRGKGHPLCGSPCGTLYQASQKEHTLRPSKSALGVPQRNNPKHRKIILHEDVRERNSSNREKLSTTQITHSVKIINKVWLVLRDVTFCSHP